MDPPLSPPPAAAAPPAQVILDKSSTDDQLMEALRAEVQRLKNRQQAAQSAAQQAAVAHTTTTATMQGGKLCTSTSTAARLGSLRSRHGPYDHLMLRLSVRAHARAGQVLCLRLCLRRLPRRRSCWRGRARRSCGCSGCARTRPRRSTRRTRRSGRSRGRRSCAETSDRGRGPALHLHPMHPSHPAAVLYICTALPWAPPRSPATAAATLSLET